MVKMPDKSALSQAFIQHIYSIVMFILYIWKGIHQNLFKCIWERANGHERENEREKQQQISAVCSSMSVISSILGPVIIHLSLSLSTALRSSSFNVLHVLLVLNTTFLLL